MNKSSFMFSVLLVGSLFFIACASTSNRTASVPDGHPDFKQLCSKCHTLDRVFAAHSTMSSEQMDTIVKRMAKKPNSGIDPSDVSDIVREIY